MDYFNQESERLTYRRLEESDRGSWAEFFNNNPNIPYLGIPDDMPLEAMLDKWFGMQFERYNENGFGMLAAISKVTGELIGQTGILKKEINGQTEYEIAYSLKPKFWRQGYASEMSQTMKRFFIEHKINTRVISIIHKDNIGSVKVAQRNGMAHLFDVEYSGMDCFVYGVEVL